MSKQCVICKKKLGLMTPRISLKDAMICKDCAKKVGIKSFKSVTYADKITAKEVLDAYHSGTIVHGNNPDYLKDEYKKLKPIFKADDAQIFDKLMIDDKRQQILIGSTLTNAPIVKKFSEIISIQPYIEPVNVKKHHGITRAVTGGIIAGGAGAVVGAVTGGKQYSAVSKLSITINFSDNSNREIVFLSSPTKTDGFVYHSLYKTYQGAINALQQIIAKNKPDDSKKVVVDVADEIRKFKKLANDGIITQAEFEAKKKQLLGL